MTEDGESERPISMSLNHLDRVIRTNIECCNWLAGHAGGMKVTTSWVSYRRAHKGWNDGNKGTRCKSSR